MVQWNSHRSFHLIRDANDDDTLFGAGSAFSHLHLGSLPGLSRRSPPGSSSSSSGGGGSDSSSSSGDSSSDSGSSSSSSSDSSGSSGDSSSGADASSACTGSNCGSGHVSTTTLAVVLGVVLPFTCALILFIVFHMKNRRKQQREEALDKHGSLDFGLGVVPREQRMAKKGRPGKQPVPEMTVTDMNPEKLLRGRGISADLGSPYLIAGEITESRTSFNSLSRDAKDADDPYGPVKSIRDRSRSPQPPMPGADHASVKTYGSGRKPLLARNSSEKSPPYASTSNTRSNSPSPTLEKQSSLSRKPVGEGNVQSNIPPPLPPPPPEKDDEPARPTSNFSFPRNVDRSSLSAKSADPSNRNSPPPPMPPRSSSKTPRMNSIDGQMSQPAPEGLAMYSAYADGLGISDIPRETSPPPANDPSAPGLTTIHEPLPPRGASLAPNMATDTRRVSTGIRPLPNLNPEDNAEQRANRIRSFYKEYFTEGGDHDEEDDGGYWGGDDYGYGGEYLNEAPIWDPNTGEFVMAGGYGEPVTRRAMTPPPRGPPRFRGQGHHYTSSSGHSAYGRTRAYSSASGRPRGRPVKKLPPPKPLHTLPTPHLLRTDDDSSLLDFAPPPSMRDIVAGRPSSPRSESRPYSPNVRAFSPVVGSHKELAVMPSPHMLRKSGTFTGLDFAPPPRFGHAENLSDGASIRSGRSGRTGMITPMAEYNVKAGTYRLSRLPKSTVGTRDDLAATLRPQWDMNR